MYQIFGRPGNLTSAYSPGIVLYNYGVARPGQTDVSSNCEKNLKCLFTDTEMFTVPCKKSLTVLCSP